MLLWECRACGSVTVTLTPADPRVCPCCAGELIANHDFQIPIKVGPDEFRELEGEALTPREDVRIG